MRWVTFVAGFLLFSSAVVAEDLVVLPSKIGDVVAPSEMMDAYLKRLAYDAFDRRKAEYEKIKTVEQQMDYGKRMREFFVAQLGGFPERTPLNAKVVGSLARDGYRIEKIIFESQPRHYVTAVLYLPLGKPPYPGVLVPCGHSANGKALYQRVCIFLAKEGLAAFCYDPIGQGERYQWLDPKGKPQFDPCTEHTLVGVGSTLLGANTARYRIWDGMRAIDYLATRSDIDPKRIGCTGNSGGGTLTSYLMALDERIVCAAPSCYLTTLRRLIDTIGPQDAEQDIYGQIAHGMDHADYLLMRAPQPTLMCVATRDYFDIDGAWQTFREAKRWYTRMGYPERVEIAETDMTHGFSPLLRLASVRWMRRWLLGADDGVTEPDFELMSDGQLQCTPGGQVMLLEGARSVFDINIGIEERLARQRREFWEKTSKTEALERVREIAGIRRPAELPQPKVEEVGTLKRDGYVVEKLIIGPESGIALPALAFVPEKPNADSYLYLHGEGKHVDAGPGGRIEELVRRGHVVLAVDLPGIGETEDKKKGDASQRYFPSNTTGYFLAYLLGKSYVGMRAEEVLVCGRFLARYRADPTPRRVHVIAIGEVGPPALHAVALEPNLFASLRLDPSLVSWSSVVRTPVTKNQLINTVHGALKTYDLPDLLATLPKEKVTIINPSDAVGNPVSREKAGP
jgi:cephalosporin-C deacetylase-like acetyl esterase